LFGARCAAPASGELNCQTACAVHDHGVVSPAAQRYSVCAGGANIFVRALRKVALLNGIPAEERSWRHSSIASRMHFLTALSGDPGLTRRFLRTIWKIKFALIALDVAGLAFGAAYIWNHPAYRRAVTTSIIEPLRQLFG
jgi:STE24 endopeptidase